MPAIARLAALFMLVPMTATSSHAISALLGVSSLMQVDQWRVSGLSLSVRYSTRPPRAPVAHHATGEPTPRSPLNHTSHSKGITVYLTESSAQRPALLLSVKRDLHTVLYLYFQ